MVHLVLVLCGHVTHLYVTIQVVQNEYITFFKFQCQGPFNLVWVHNIKVIWHGMRCEGNLVLCMIWVKIAVVLMKDMLLGRRLICNGGSTTTEQYLKNIYALHCYQYKHNIIVISNFTYNLAISTIFNHTRSQI